ncbi:hypothetical protein C3747_64g138 [Trypanosoma cruzi]|uniref:Uncharacterized protein n=2 Tax=Trypanosoma cruzi TaxID=5693 RepID=Q4DGA7_TRYCC|nr:hypothetical protein, conserved [Trypanosoma cruzi]EAN91565.1 hypothetical protein, conserved [Trypanosoma cruzi]PWV10912.1 hypothetical protein C3747_64g138 [Trypanosoma cruzi]RNC56542.1 hypothetical protein TcCL_ESM05907 [Trypanosoma cruzi]|eukprot:XP_813416.1 hypothetical protein [Trypanosoma cruzi strain CL Brener]
MDIHTRDDPFAYGYGNGYGVVDNVDTLDGLFSSTAPDKNSQEVGVLEKKQGFLPLLQSKGTPGFCSPPRKSPSPKLGGNDKNGDDEDVKNAATTTTTTVARRTRVSLPNSDATRPLARSPDGSPQRGQGAAAGNVGQVVIRSRVSLPHTKPNGLRESLSQPRQQPLSKALHDGTNKNDIPVDAPPNGRRVSTRKIFFNATATKAQNNAVKRQGGEDGRRKIYFSGERARAPTEKASVTAIPGAPGEAFIRRKHPTVSEAPTPGGKNTLKSTSTAPVSVCTPSKSENNKTESIQPLKKTDGWVEKEQDMMGQHVIAYESPPTEDGKHPPSNVPEIDNQGPPVHPSVNDHQKTPKTREKSDSIDHGYEDEKAALHRSFHTEMWDTLIEVSGEKTLTSRSEEYGTERSHRGEVSRESTDDMQEMHDHIDELVSTSAEAMVRLRLFSSAEKRWPEIEMWAAAPLLMFTPPPNPNSSTAGVIEYAGEQLELDWNLHNVIAQVFHHDRPRNLTYPEEMPLELEKTKTKRRPRTPRSFYGVKGARMPSDWFRHALGNIKHVNSPDLEAIDAAEVSKKISHSRVR